MKVRHRKHRRPTRDLFMRAYRLANAGMWENTAYVAHYWAVMSADAYVELIETAVAHPYDVSVPYDPSATPWALTKLQ